MPKTKQPEIEVRWIDDDDPEVIARISCAHFGGNGLTSKDVYRFMDRTDHIPKVIRVGGETVGYLFYVLEKGVVMIEEIAVAQPRKGHGSRLIRHLLASLRKLRRPIVAVKVPETNLAAQLFFKAMGFKAFRIIERQGREPHYAMKYIVPSARK